MDAIKDLPEHFETKPQVHSVYTSSKVVHNEDIQASQLSLLVFATQVMSLHRAA